MNRFKGYAYIMAASLAASTSPVQAQHQDIALLSQAMEMCDVPGNLGYNDYDICVQQTYQDLINNPRPGTGGRGTPIWGCDATYQPGASCGGF